MFRLISLVALTGSVIVCMLHYAALGTRRWKPDKGTAFVYRFSIWERLTHTLCLLGFLTLAVTGFWAVIVLRGPLHGWLWILHVGSGAVFAVTMVLMMLLWAMDCRFEDHDWIWARHVGSYLGGDDRLPAGRFNAGQKAYFWCSVLLGLVTHLSGLGLVVPVFGLEGQELIGEIHRYGALLFAMSAIVHLYLATLANRGTLRSIVLGTVSAEWAEHHHPAWREGAGGSPDTGPRE